MSRVDLPEEKRRDFYLYVDEFQNFATDSFADILSEARKYRLSLILANQYISQLEEMTATGRSTKVRDSVFGNVGTIITFRIGAEDAEFLEREFLPEFTAEDLVNLGKYNIYIKLMIDGVTGSPFSAETLPPFKEKEKSNREKIISVSREKYGIPKEIIEDKINRWVGTADSSPMAVSQRSGGQATLYDAQCSNCKKMTKVVFPPDGVRPVYCKSCLKQRERNKEREEPRVSFREVADNTVSFSPSHKKEPLPAPQQIARKKPVVNVDELKKALEQALNKDKEDKKN